MNECIDFLGKAAICSTLNADSGYRKAAIDNKDLDKTAYTPHHGLYRFLQMALELWNAPNTFQQPIDITHSAVE